MTNKLVHAPDTDWPFYWSSENVNPYPVRETEWPAIVGLVFHKWKKEQTADFKRQYFLPDVSWQEMAEYLVDIGAISV